MFLQTFFKDFLSKKFHHFLPAFFQKALEFYLGILPGMPFNISKKFPEAIPPRASQAVFPGITQGFFSEFFREFSWDWFRYSSMDLLKEYLQRFI